MFILKNNPSLRRMSQIRRNFGATCTLKGTRARKSLVGDHYTQAQGRSMVEMLGVLAIIGVLSVGAIAGYSKAMTKYKLNKQAEQISWLLNAMYRYKDLLGQDKHFASFVPYLKKLGEIPQEMIKDNSIYLYDSFGMKYEMGTNGCHQTCEYANMVIYVTDNKNFDICHNILDTTKAFTTQLDNIIIYDREFDSDLGMIYGDKSCKDGDKCLKDLTKEDIYDICKRCTDKNICTFNIQYTIVD